MKKLKPAWEIIKWLEDNGYKYNVSTGEYTSTKCSNRFHMYDIMTACARGVAEQCTENYVDEWFEEDDKPDNYDEIMKTWSLYEWIWFDSNRHSRFTARLGGLKWEDGNWHYTPNGGTKLIYKTASIHPPLTHEQVMAGEWFKVKPQRWQKVIDCVYHDNEQILYLTNDYQYTFEDLAKLTHAKIPPEG